MNLITKIKNFLTPEKSNEPAEAKTNDLTRNRTFKLWGMVVSGGLILILTFAAGVFVGLEKAEFSYKWGENYYRNFVGFMPPPVPGVKIRFSLPTDSDYMNAHGILGKVIKISGNTITITDDDGTEKNIIASGQTIFAKGRGNISLSDIKINDSLVVIGSPDNLGQMQAKLIRVVNQ
jgi:hypothetical protein